MGRYRVVRRLKGKRDAGSSGRGTRQAAGLPTGASDRGDSVRDGSQVRDRVVGGSAAAAACGGRGAQRRIQLWVLAALLEGGFDPLAHRERHHWEVPRAIRCLTRNEMRELGWFDLRLRYLPLNRLDAGIRS